MLDILKRGVYTQQVKGNQNANVGPKKGCTSTKETMCGEMRSLRFPFRLLRLLGRKCHCEAGSDQQLSSCRLAELLMSALVVDERGLTETIRGAGKPF